MTTKELLENLLQGKKMKQNGWYEMYICLDKFGILVDQNGKLVAEIPTYVDWNEYKEEILDKEEKEYLESFLRPFKDAIIDITKLGNEKYEFLTITYRDKDNDDREMFLPYFDINTMYKGMQKSKEYTLKDLGLFDRKIF